MIRGTDGGSDPRSRHVDDLRVDGGLVDSVAETLQEVGVRHDHSGPLRGALLIGNVAVHVEVLVSDHVDTNPVGVESVQENLGHREEVIVDIAGTDAQLLLHGIASLRHTDLSILGGKDYFLIQIILSTGTNLVTLLHL